MKTKLLQQKLRFYISKEGSAMALAGYAQDSVVSHKILLINEEVANGKDDHSIGVQLEKSPKEFHSY